ncbi:hypothetical protein BD779DRAFT_1516235 [Infundibulicybe gibba]|nr:hypothetical protein BD779DRAFT_1516235 [Infundibulicybe gibba]
MPWLASALRAVAQPWFAISATPLPVKVHPRQARPGHKLDRDWLASCSFFPRLAQSGSAHGLDLETPTVRLLEDIPAPARAISGAGMSFGLGTSRSPEPAPGLRSADIRPLGSTSFLSTFFIFSLEWVAVQLKGTTILLLAATTFRLFTPASTTVDSRPRCGQDSSYNSASDDRVSVFTTPAPRKKVARRLPPAPPIPRQSPLGRTISQLEGAPTDSEICCLVVSTPVDLSVDDIAPADAPSGDQAVLPNVPARPKRATRWGEPLPLSFETGQSPLNCPNTKLIQQPNTEHALPNVAANQNQLSPNTPAPNSTPATVGNILTSTTTARAHATLNPHAPVFTPRTLASPPMSRRARARRLALARKRRAIMSLIHAKPCPHLVQPPNPPQPPPFVLPPPPPSLFTLQPKHLQQPIPWVRPQQLIPPRMRAAAPEFVPKFVPEPLGAGGL